MSEKELQRLKERYELLMSKVKVVHKIQQESEWRKKECERLEEKCQHLKEQHDRLQKDYESRGAEIKQSVRNGIWMVIILGWLLWIAILNLNAASLIGFSLIVSLYALGRYMDEYTHDKQDKGHRKRRNFMLVMFIITVILGVLANNGVLKNGRAEWIPDWVFRFLDSGEESRFIEP